MGGEPAVGLGSEAHLSDVSSHASAWASSADEAIGFPQYDTNRSHLYSSTSSTDLKRGQRRFSKKIAVGAFVLAAIVVLCLGRLLKQRKERAQFSVDAHTEPFLYGLDALYAGNIDFEGAREAARRWPVSSLEMLEQDAVKLLKFIDGFEAEESVIKLRSLISEAKLEESRLQEVLPVSAALSTPEASQVARTTQVRASVDRLRQHFHSALGEAHILHRLARRFLLDAEGISEIFLQRIAACAVTLQVLEEGAKKAVKEAGFFRVHLQRVQDLAKEAEKDLSAIQSARERVNAGVVDLPNLSLAEAIDAVQIALENVLRMQRMTSESWGWMEDGERALQVVAKNFATQVSVQVAAQHSKIEQVRYFSESLRDASLDAAHMEKLAASAQRMQQYGQQLRDQRRALAIITNSGDTAEHLQRASELLRNVTSNAWAAHLPATKRGSFAAALKRASKQQQQQQTPGEQKQQQQESSDELQHLLPDKQQYRRRKRPLRRPRGQEQQISQRQQLQRSGEGNQQQPADRQQQQLSGKEQDHSSEERETRLGEQQHASKDPLSKDGVGGSPDDASRTLEELRSRLLSAVSAAAEGVAGACVGGSSLGTASSQASGERLESLDFPGFHRSSDLLAEWLRQVEAADFAASAMRTTIRQLQEAEGQTSIVAAADQTIELAVVAAERFQAAAKLAMEGKGWARLEENLRSAIQVYREMLKSASLPPPAVLQAHHLTAEAFLSKAVLVGRQRDLGRACRMACELTELERKLAKLVRQQVAATTQQQLQQLGPLPLHQNFDARKEEVLGLAKTAEQLVSRAQRDVLLLVEKAELWAGKVTLPEVSSGALVVRRTELRVRDVAKQLQAALGKLRKATTKVQLGHAGFEVLRAKEELLSLTREAHFAHQKSLLALFRAGVFAQSWADVHRGQVAVRPLVGYADSLQEALASAWQAVELREQLVTRAHVELRKFPGGDPRSVLTESRLREEGAMVSAFLQHLQGLVRQASLQDSIGDAGVLPVLLAEAQSCAKSVWQLALCVDMLIYDKQNSLDMVDALVPDSSL